MQTKPKTIKYEKIEIPIKDGTSPYMPQKASKFVDHGNIMKTLAIAIRDNLAVLLIGESGCLHPNTPIYDPIDKTTKTVKERSLENKEFNVYTLNEKQEIIITKAEIPKSYCKTKMYKLSNGINEITVTGLHRIWNGKAYVPVKDLPQYSPILLPSILESSLSKLPLNVQNSSQINEDSQSDCHQSDHSHDQQPHQESKTDQDTFPLTPDAHELDYVDSEKDALNHKEECTHAYPSSDPHSTLDSSNQKNNNSSNELNNHLTEDTSLPISQTPSLFDKFSSLKSPVDATKHTDQPSVDSKPAELSSYLLSSYSKYSTWTVNVQQDEIYYDFHVPIYENYYACGLFHHNTGKTSAIRFLANQTKNGLRRVNLNGGTTADELVGRLLINDKGTYWVDGILTEAMRNGDWIVLDEINAALPEVLFVLQSIMDDDGYLVLNEKDDKEIVHRHPNFRIFATCNPPEYAGTKEMNKALLSRFAICINAEFPPSAKELEIIENHLGNTIAKSEMAIKLVGLANHTRTDKEQGNSDYVINTRDILNTLRLTEFMEPMEALGLAFSNKLESTDNKAIKIIAKLHLPLTKKKAKATRKAIKIANDLKLNGNYIIDADLQNTYLGLTKDDDVFKEMIEKDLGTIITDYGTNRENAIKGDEIKIQATYYENAENGAINSEETTLGDRIASAVSIINGPNKGKNAIILHHKDLDNSIEIIKNLFEIS